MNQKAIHLFLVLLFSLPLMLQAQDPLAVSYYRDAEKEILKNNPKKAIRLFKKAIRENPNLTAAYRGMGLASEMINDYNAAAEYYEEVMAMDSMYSRPLYYELGEIHYKIGNVDRALYYFEKYKALQDTTSVAFTISTESEYKVNEEGKMTEFGLNAEREKDLEQEFAEKVDGSIRACYISQDSSKFREVKNIVNLGTAINSNKDEVFPYLSNDQAILFYTRRDNKKDDDDLMFSKYESNKWRNSSPLGGSFNSRSPEGMSTLVRDGKMMYFTACQREQVYGYCDIWEATMDGTDASNVKPIMGYANSGKWESQASVSCDGSTLYFASDRPGGLGGIDIWKSTKDADGHWLDPINLGPRINTPEDEEAPFISNDGKTLYFSSTGHLGMGKQDIFVSFQDENDEWGTPVNLGPPINTAYWEFGFFISADGSTGYFASDRPDGFGGMDIYKFELDQELHSDAMTFVEGYVRDAVDGSPIPTTVYIEGREGIKTTAEGRFFVCISSGDTINILVEAPNYKTFQQISGIPQWDNRNFYPMDIDLVPLNYNPPVQQARGIPEPRKKREEPAPKIKLRKNYTHEIFFAFDKAELTPTEAEKLDDFFAEHAKKKILRIEVFGFADDVGKEDYNYKLSEERAKNIAFYLFAEKGIPTEIVEREGRGPISNNKRKAENRKVTLKIFTEE